jgi:S1-C subfamily serine protease
LSKEEVAAERDRIDSTDNRDLVEHYDDILKLTQESNPGAQGLTLQGLQEYYKRNDSFKVDTAAGTFDAKLVAESTESDIAILQVSNLSHEQQQRLGSNLPLANEQPTKGEPVVATGYVKGDFKSRFGAVIGIGRLLDHDGSDQLKTNAYIEHGLSGGPLRRSDVATPNHAGDVVGVNHGSALGAVGYHGQTPDLRKLLRAISSGEIPIHRSP